MPPKKVAKTPAKGSPKGNKRAVVDPSVSLWLDIRRRLANCSQTPSKKLAKALKSPVKTPLKAANALSQGIPCGKCAKRLIYDSASKSNDRKATSGTVGLVDGAANFESASCRYHVDGKPKCAHCRATKKPCKPVSDFPATRWRSANAVFARLPRNTARRFVSSSPGLSLSTTTLRRRRPTC